jgi:hypothetical protein
MIAGEGTEQHKEPLLSNDVEMQTRPTAKTSITSSLQPPSDNSHRQSATISSKSVTSRVQDSLDIKEEDLSNPAVVEKVVNIQPVLEQGGNEDELEEQEPPVVDLALGITSGGANDDVSAFSLVLKKARLEGPSDVVHSLGSNELNHLKQSQQMQKSAESQGQIKNSPSVGNFMKKSTVLPAPIHASNSSGNLMKQSNDAQIKPSSSIGNLMKQNSLRLDMNPKLTQRRASMSRPRDSSETDAEATDSAREREDQMIFGILGVEKKSAYAIAPHRTEWQKRRARLRRVTFRQNLVLSLAIYLFQAIAVSLRYPDMFVRPETGAIVICAFGCFLQIWLGFRGLRYFLNRATSKLIPLIQVFQLYFATTI